MKHDCDREIRAVPDGWAMSGHRQNGEEWTCSCGKAYVHICDEAEGCSWVPFSGVRVIDTLHPLVRKRWYA